MFEEPLESTGDIAVQQNYSDIASQRGQSLARLLFP